MQDEPAADRGSQRILVTGATGFIAKHVVLKLLNAGHVVRGTVRNLDRAEEMRSALAPMLMDPAALDRLSLVQADLTLDAGWAEAMAGMDAVMHTASPFPTRAPKDPMELIGPARDGTLRVLAAAEAAGVRRVIVTSSIAAVVPHHGAGTFSETDWLDPEVPGVSAYSRSKVLAERAAWDFAGAKGLALSVVNPAFVLGPPLDRNYGESVGVIRRLLRGRDPMLPDLSFAVVDVRDVAEVHLRVLERAGTEGKRFIASAGGITMVQMGQVLKAAHPTRRIPTRQAPNLLIRALALVDPQVRSIVGDLGIVVRVDAGRAERELGMRFISPEGAVRAAGDWLVDHGEV